MLASAVPARGLSASSASTRRSRAACRPWTRSFRRSRRPSRRRRGCSLCRVAGPGAATGPVVTLAAGERGAAAIRVDDAELAVLASSSAEVRPLDRLLGGHALPEKREPVRPVARIRVGLGRHGARLRLRPRHDRADAEKLDCVATPQRPASRSQAAIEYVATRSSHRSARPRRGRRAPAGRPPTRPRPAKCLEHVRLRVGADHDGAALVERRRIAASSSWSSTSRRDRPRPRPRSAAPGAPSTRTSAVSHPMVSPGSMTSSSTSVSFASSSGVPVSSGKVP